MNATILLEHDPPVPGEPLLVRALLRITGEAPTDRDRIPLNLCLVLDRSGSMSGAKLDGARRAASLAVQRLWPEDVVSVVAYDGEVRVVAEPARGGRQGDLSRRIRGIESGGMTNLSGGWLKGRELVAVGADPNGVNRILLLTDGLANRGIRNPDLLVDLCRDALADHVTTTTIGFGTDFDEALLRAMADAGGGATYYIEEADQAPGVFEEELEGLLSLVAQNVRVDMRPDPRVRIAAVRHSFPSTRTPAGVRLELGDLYAREPKRLLVELVVEEMPRRDALELGTIELAADVLGQGGGIEHRTVALPFTVSVADGARVTPEVERETLLLDAADARERALERQQDGDYASAVNVLDEAGERLRRSPQADDRILEEAEDLERLSHRLAGGAMDAADRKYMYQRAYDAGRGRGASYRKISRAKRARGER